VTANHEGLRVLGYGNIVSNIMGVWAWLIYIFDNVLWRAMMSSRDAGS